MQTPASEKMTIISNQAKDEPATIMPEHEFRIVLRLALSVSAHSDRAARGGLLDLKRATLMDGTTTPASLNASVPAAALITDPQAHTITPMCHGTGDRLAKSAMRLDLAVLTDCVPARPAAVARPW